MRELAETRDKQAAAQAEPATPAQDAGSVAVEVNNQDGASGVSLTVSPLAEAPSANSLIPPAGDSKTDSEFPTVLSSAPPPTSAEDPNAVRVASVFIAVLLSGCTSQMPCAHLCPHCAG